MWILELLVHTELDHVCSGWVPGPGDDNKGSGPGLRWANLKPGPAGLQVKVAAVQ